jgi:hypothetical protein
MRFRILWNELTLFAMKPTNFFEADVMGTIDDLASDSLSHSAFVGVRLFVSAAAVESVDIVLKQATNNKNNE